MPDYTDRLKFFQNPIPIFAYYHVEEQIEATFERVVQLPSGGSIVIDTTEALVAIDVNSGKNTGEGGHEETVYKTNCEAAEEVARQLKLRDLGGIVVVDFIDMEVSKHKREVESVLSEAAKDDKARYKISRINSKGLCVLTRQRIRQGMRKAFQRRCEICSGTGWLRTGESHSLSVLRRIETRLAQGEVGEVRVLTHKETAEYLANHKRQDLLRLEREYHCRILVFARAEMDRGKDEVTYLSKGQILSELTDRLPQREERRNDRGKQTEEAAQEEAQPREQPGAQRHRRPDVGVARRRSAGRQEEKNAAAVGGMAKSCRCRPRPRAGHLRHRPKAGRRSRPRATRPSPAVLRPRCWLASRRSAKRGSPRSGLRAWMSRPIFRPR
jgi:ribonuclease E